MTAPRESSSCILTSVLFAPGAHPGGISPFSDTVTITSSRFWYDNSKPLMVSTRPPSTGRIFFTPLIAMVYDHTGSFSSVTNCRSS